VLGEMLELGSLSEESHRKMGRDAGESGASGLFFVQGDARFAAQECRAGPIPAEFFESTEGVAERLGPLMNPGDVAVVKASRGVRAERVVQGLADFFRVHTQPFEKASSVDPEASSS
jgi:UDP-N-acetylmuramyl pentapeptide synthase